MYYPEEFSKQARARVEAERLKADRDLDNIRKHPQKGVRRRRTQGPYGLRWSDEEEDFHNYILRVFLVFAHEACELGKQGRWAVDQIRSESEDFLRRFAAQACYEKGDERSGRIQDVISNWNGGLLLDVGQEFQRSDEWRQFEDALLKVAEEGANGRQPGSASGDPIQKLLNRASWLKARLLERGWSNSDPSQFGGPDRKTVEKILRGEAVRNDVLEKLASALSSKRGNVDVHAIPSD